MNWVIGAYDSVNGPRSIYRNCMSRTRGLYAKGAAALSICARYRYGSGENNDL